MRFYFISFLLFLNSCNYSIKSSFEKKNYLEAININQIDHFPAFLSCDSLSNINRERCFKEGVLRRVKKNLSRENIQVEGEINEQVILSIKVCKTGNIKLEKIQSSKAVLKKIPMLDSLLNTAIKKLPKVKPAIKKGVAVTSQFTLPIKIY